MDAKELETRADGIACETYNRGTDHNHYGSGGLQGYDAKGEITLLAREYTISELEKLRKEYDQMERQEEDLGTQHWMDWKGVRNRIGDRIAALRGGGEPPIPDTSYGHPLINGEESNG